MLSSRSLNDKTPLNPPPGTSLIYHNLNKSWKLDHRQMLRQTQGLLRSSGHVMGVQKPSTHAQILRGITALNPNLHFV
jgi:trans-aconitate methyltransferase